MIDFFKSRATEEKWENVDTDILDVRDLKTLKDGTFSHVITNFGFAPDTSDLEGPGRASKEVWRVLREGGVAVTTIWAGVFWLSLSLLLLPPMPFSNVETWKSKFLLMDIE
jgi:ubiquinone/menaquinone biosynthesis C-methylase UbiE